jgi:hypothetical protein
MLDEYVSTMVLLVHKNLTTHVTHEGVEGTEHHPLRTEDVRSISGCEKELSDKHRKKLAKPRTISADIGPHHGHLVDRWHPEHPCDRVPVVLPSAEVVPEPLADMFRLLGASPRKNQNVLGSARNCNALGI